MIPFLVIFTVLALVITSIAISKISHYITWYRLSRSKDHKVLPSIPQKDVFFGLGLVYRWLLKFDKKQSHSNLGDLFTMYGDTFQRRSYWKNEIFTVSPKVVEWVFSTNFTSFGVGLHREKVMSPLTGPGLLTSDGVEWRCARKILSPAFTASTAPNLRRFNVHIRRLIQKLPLDGSTVDLQPLFHMLSLDSSTEFMFGISFDSLGPNGLSVEDKEFLDSYHYAVSVLDEMLWRRSWNPFARREKFSRACATAKAHVDRMIEKSITLQRSLSKIELPEAPVLAHQLLNETNDLIYTRQQLMNVFLPGHDTVGVLLSNVFFMLARHPAVWTKLQKEIALTGDSELTSSDLQNLTYLQAVLKETLRLNPSLGLLERVALRDTTIPSGEDGSESTPYMIKKGATVIISIYDLQRRKDLWGNDANDFRPDRFTEANPVPWARISFGAGPRACPGQRIGLSQVAYSVVMILRKFKEIENRDPVMEFEELRNISSVSKNGIKVALIPV